MEIIKIIENKDKFMDLLLLADEQESMVKKYLYRGELFALYDEDLKTVAVVTKENENTCEIKNIATYEKYQRKGYGKIMIKYLIEIYKVRCNVLLVGTGDSNKTISFYENCGFKYSHKVKNFFVDNYDHEMFEEGKQLIDMIYLKIVFTMDINEDEIVLRPFTKNDVNLFRKWINKDYIYKWLCPDGEKEKEAWLNEVNDEDGKYNHMKHFIVNYREEKIGFCIFFDCHFEHDYSREIYGKTFEENYAYEIGFFIGEEEYLNKGIGKIIIRKLEEKITEIGGKEILADPDEGNILSIKALLRNGFTKIKDGDYRKKVNIINS